MLTKRMSIQEKHFNLRYCFMFIFLLGFSSGLPFLLTLSTLSYWLTESGVHKTAIGFFMLVGLPYSFKFLWAPLVDRLSIPYLTKKMGQRRSWAVVTQIGLFFSLMGLGQANPQHNLYAMAFLAFLVSLFAATQDIVIDGYRIETIQKENRGMAAALESIGFKFGMLASGAGALYLADCFGWSFSYFIMALLVSVGFLTVLWMPEPARSYDAASPKARLTVRSVFITPLTQLKKQPYFYLLLVFILFFKMPDTILNAMGAPFLYELGVSKVEFAHISKLFGITLMVFGGLSGGMAIKYLGTFQSMILCSILQATSCLMFVIQAIVGYNLAVLTITVGFESFCSGLISAVFIAYLSNFCSPPHTATHFTLLYSLGSLSRVVTSALAGWMADHTEWSSVFLFAGFLTLPCLVIIYRLHKIPAYGIANHSPKKAL